MIPKIRQFPATLFSCLLFLVSALPQASDDTGTGITPVEPFRIAGNIYYIGSSDLTAFLIVTPGGNIVLDSGPKEMVPQITAGITKLGFKPSDTKLILNSHAHFDHAGGIGELRRLTGARFLASRYDTPLLVRGGLNDPNFGDRFPFEPTKPDESFEDGTKVQLGGTELTANITAGHTKGCTTWTTSVKEAGKSYRVIFLCSVSAPGYKLVGNERYPSIENDYRTSFNWLKRLKVDIFLGSHASFFDLMGKAKTIGTGKGANPFIDPDGYAAFIENSEKTFNEQLKTQKAGTK